jgi:ABC-type phosphate/phosphonate transport system substrate-binding protein
MGNRTSGFRSLARAVAIRCVLAILPLSAQDSPLPNSTVVVGFSSRVMGHANPVDLKAAMKAWLQALARERHLEVEARAEVFDSVNDMASALRQGKLDVVSLPADDFFSLEKQVPLAGMFTNQVRRKAGDQYVVLVRQDQAVKDLASLRGGSIVVLDQTHTLLAPLWLDTELLRKRLPAATRHFARVTHAANPSLALMPVFFKRADATLMTRAGFETACELNPQMASQLTVLLA